MSAPLKRLVGRGIRAVDRLLPTQPGVTVLAYHRAGGRTPVSVDLPVAQLAEQLDWLVSNALVLSLDAAADELAPPVRPGPVSPSIVRPGVVLTADDGTEDWVDELLPLLVERSIPMTWFVATAFVDEQRPFPNDGHPLTWTVLSEAVSTGLITVGSHTHEHLVMTRIDAATAAADLDRSTGLIEDRLGVACRHFAYPKARPGGDEADREVWRRFRTASLAGNRVNVPGACDLARLGRTPVQRSDALADFARLAAGHGRLQGAARDRLDRARHRNAVS